MVVPIHFTTDEELSNCQENKKKSLFPLYFISYLFIKFNKKKQQKIMLTVKCLYLNTFNNFKQQQQRKKMKEYIFKVSTDNCMSEGARPLRYFNFGHPYEVIIIFFLSFSQTGWTNLVYRSNFDKKHYKRPRKKSRLT